MLQPVSLALVLAVALGAVAPCAAQRRAVVRGPRGNVHVGRPRVHHVFRTTDRGLFRNYFRQHRIVVTPLRTEMIGLVVRGKPIPVTIVRTLLPRDLLTLVPLPEPGYEYLIVGDRVVMLDGEGLVEDILEDVFP